MSRCQTCRGSHFERFFDVILLAQSGSQFGLDEFLFLPFPGQGRADLVQFDAQGQDILLVNLPDAAPPPVVSRKAPFSLRARKRSGRLFSNGEVIPPRWNNWHSPPGKAPSKKAQISSGAGNNSGGAGHPETNLSKTCPGWAARVSATCFRTAGSARESIGIQKKQTRHRPAAPPLFMV
jgi:hypothetical protein